MKHVHKVKFIQSTLSMLSFFFLTKQKYFSSPLPFHLQSNTNDKN